MMKTTTKFFNVIILFVTLMCANLNIAFSSEVANLMNANVDDSLNANTQKKKTRKKRVVAAEEPGYVNEQLEDENSKAHIVHPESAEELGWHHKLRLTLLPSFMTVEGVQMSNNSKGILNSRLYTAVKIDYTYRTKNWIFTLITGYKQVKFENSDDRTLMTPKHKLIRNDVMIARRFGHVAIGIGAGGEDKFFYKMVNSSFADVDTSNDKKIYTTIDYNFFRHQKYTSSINFKAGINPKEKSDVYDIQTGTFYSTSLKIDYAIRDDKKIGLEIFYKNEDYKTQQLHLKASEIGLGVSFGHDWGAGK